MHAQEGKQPRDIECELWRPQGTVRAQRHRSLRHVRVALEPRNSAFGPIALTTDDEERVRVPAEFLEVL